MILTYRRINYRIYCVEVRPFRVCNLQIIHWHVIQRYAIPAIMMYHIRIRIHIIIWRHRHRQHRKQWAFMDLAHKVRVSYRIKSKFYLVHYFVYLFGECFFSLSLDVNVVAVFGFIFEFSIHPLNVMCCIRFVCAVFFFVIQHLFSSCVNL